MLTGKEALEKNYDSLRKTLIFRGGKNFNVDEYMTCGMGAGVAYLNQLAEEYDDDEMNPVVVDFWANFGKGLKKELHNPESWRRRWASYVPLSAYKSENKDRKYPVIFVNHGGKTTLMRAEAYGFTHLAAEQECIVIIPENMLEWNFMSILLEIIETYPVDRNRIYMTGFSSGAFRSISFAYMYPEVVAATFCGGIEPFSSYRPHWVAGPNNNHEEPMGIVRVKFDPANMCTMHEYERFPESVYDFANKCGVPYMNFVGTAEQPEHTPFYKTVSPYENKPFYRIPEYILEQVNNLRKANGMRKLDIFELLACKNSEDLVTRTIGLPFNKTWTEKIDGAVHYFGDMASDDGIARCRFIAVENSPHQAEGSMATIAWDFMKHFSRDPVTHQSVYTE